VEEKPYDQKWWSFAHECNRKLLERLDQAILDVINNPKKTQKTALT
jgi:hypothetical protein